MGIDAASLTRGFNEEVTNTFKILRIRKDRAWKGRELVENYLWNHPDKFVIVVDEEVDSRDLSTVMWKVFNNIDAKRDIAVIDFKIGVDATKKWKQEGLTREWPDDIVMTGAMKRQVDKRWNEYGID
nr:UbiD family decarboxylase domain-containing protein [Caproiciproducens faecalis]